VKRTFHDKTVQAEVKKHTVTKNNSVAEEIKKEAPKLFKVTIDNITIEVSAGTSILNAARQIGGEVAPPCGGRSGLPKDWACAFAAAATIEPAAVTASRLRREMGFIAFSPAVLPVAGSGGRCLQIGCAPIGHTFVHPI